MVEHMEDSNFLQVLEKNKSLKHLQFSWGSFIDPSKAPLFAKFFEATPFLQTISCDFRNSCNVILLHLHLFQLLYRFLFAIL